MGNSWDESGVPAMTDPLVFDSYYRPQIWGGRGLCTQLGRDLPDERPYGEAWDVSPQPLHVSRVLEGPQTGRDLNTVWKILCGNVASPLGFPLLVKWLECHEFLSLQVHPDDQMAQSVLNEPFGKSEAWVVISAEPSARIFAGLKPGVTREVLIDHIRSGQLAECLHSFVPAAGDCVSLPAGTVHAAGGGLIVAEIQQSSDATFRLYDWDRPGLDGRPRPLQVERALEAINWNQGPISPVIPVEMPSDGKGVRSEKLVEGNGFRLERYFVDQSMMSPHTNELTIWMVLEGTALLTNPKSGYRRKFPKGTTAVIPANASPLCWETVSDHPNLTLLCTRLRSGLS